MSPELDRVCMVCGLLDSEGGCDHRDDCKRETEVVRPKSTGELAAVFSTVIERATR